MNILPNQISILSPGANMVFGEPTSISGNYVLDATLRYFTLKNSGLPLEKMANRVATEFIRVESDRELLEVFGESHRSFVVARSSTYVAPEDFATPEGWTALNTPPYNVSMFLTQCVGKSKTDRPSRSLVYINEAKQRVVVYTSGLTPTWLDALSATLPRILRWYFAPGSMSPEDHAFSQLIFGQQGGDAAAQTAGYIKTVNILVAKYDFEATRLTKLFDGYGNRMRDQRVASLNSNIESSYEEIRKLHESLAEYYSQLATQQTELQAFSLLSDVSNNDVLDFFRKHKNIYVHEVNDSDISYSVIDTLEYYDEDDFAKVYANPRSYAGENNAPAWVRDVMHALFIDHKAVLKTEARFKLTALRALEARGSSERDADAFPHPHLVEYHCLGANQQEMDKCLAVGDWMMAVEQSIAATKNIAFKDTTVCTKFVSKLESCSSRRCIILPDQTALTLPEFRKMLDDEKKKAEKPAAKKKEGASANG